MRYLMDFSYSGASFNGYQKQNGLKTIQGEIEGILTSINGNEKVLIYSSGRTDKGVNALHQMAHFNLNKNISPYKLKGALNSYLSDDIYVNDIKQVNDDFHARYMVKSKVYEYKINIGNYNPLLRNFVYQYCMTLNIKNMKKAIKSFIGTHDFTTFSSAEDKRSDKVRTIYNASLNIKDEIITISFEGSGFLKYQIRNMVGTLIKIGEDKISFNIIDSLFEKKDRRFAFSCAPACGLCLVKVNYK